VLLLEAHLLDRPATGDWDLYGERATVELVQRIRGQARFDTVDDLVDRIALDVADAATLLD
jgi:riboflavin kinase/FMN adenylyltransferase